VFLKAILLSYLWVAIVDMERGTLIQYFEVAIIHEESFIDVDNKKVILDVYSMMKGEKKKVEKPPTNVSKLRKEC
jgi:hypothetical protein